MPPSVHSAIIPIRARTSNILVTVGVKLVGGTLHGGDVLEYKGTGGFVGVVNCMLDGTVFLIVAFVVSGITTNDIADDAFFGIRLTSVGDQGAEDRDGDRGEGE